MKHLFITIISGFFISIPLMGASKITLGTEDNKVTKTGVISVYSSWLKEKGKKYDLDFNLRNEHDKGIILLVNEVHCYRGKEEGITKLGGDNAMYFRAGELKDPVLTCKLSTSEPGEYRVTIGKIHENISGDGKSLGKVLSKGLEWKLKLAN